MDGRDIIVTLFAIALVALSTLCIDLYAGKIHAEKEASALRNLTGLGATDTVYEITADSFVAVKRGG